MIYHEHDVVRDAVPYVVQHLSQLGLPALGPAEEVTSKQKILPPVVRDYVAERGGRCSMGAVEGHVQALMRVAIGQVAKNGDLSDAQIAKIKDPFIRRLVQAAAVVSLAPAQRRQELHGAEAVYPSERDPGCGDAWDPDLDRPHGRTGNGGPDDVGPLPEDGSSRRTSGEDNPNVCDGGGENFSSSNVCD
jgi:hypothetical protein